MKQILLIMIGLSVNLLADFTKNNGIVADSITTLQWQDDYSDNAGSIKQTTWTAAIDYCEALTLDGHNDWRLPNLRELTSLVDDSRVAPAISTVFEHTASNRYWSSTTFAGDSNFAWYVNFNDGLQDGNNKSISYYVRCVRAGQP